ncbi:proline dehydrogenase family protein [Pseudonocardia acidicola]|uniref:proline dehydrogenase n=1 Tax=Pseudonocardia acidicola TaxID=2724939 RepID=A0ABX1SBV9_9PSEU|nr:proline dehydrogenase family protein [Pseudonocardia acidicola]NMH98022.1 proline dehydrogenase [Pseudonocardia acidicola]
MTAAPPTRAVVNRFVAGETTADALRVATELVRAGRRVSLDHLGEDVTEAGEAALTVEAYTEVLAALADAGLAGRVEVSVKLSALGQTLDEDLAAEHAMTICAAAETAGTTVTLDAENHTTTDSALRVLARLRTRWPSVGAVLQAYLRRTEDDCRALAGPGSRVRLCKGAYAEPGSVAFTDAAQVRASFARCTDVLLGGAGYPMFATHDPALIALVTDRIRATGRGRDDVEFQMLHGVRPDEQRRLVDAGHTVRIYVPYGTQWYGYLMRRLAERPANAAFFLRALIGRR